LEYKIYKNVGKSIYPFAQIFRRCWRYHQQKAIPNPTDKSLLNFFHNHPPAGAGLQPVTINQY